MHDRSIDLEKRLQRWLDRADLEKSKAIAISRLSRAFEKIAVSYLENRLSMKSVHMYSYHLSLDHATAVHAHAEGKFLRNFQDLVGIRRLIFLHDVEDVSSLREFAAYVRSALEKTARSTIVLMMRPATQYDVFKQHKSPLFGRVVSIEEPTLSETGIVNEAILESGYLDLYNSFLRDRQSIKKATTDANSSSFNLLALFWYFLKKDSRKAGSVRLVASCLAHYDEPLTIDTIDAKCGISHSRQAVHAAIRTGMIKMTEKEPRRAYVYPPLLAQWTRANVPFR